MDALDLVRKHPRKAVSRSLEVRFGACEAGRDRFAEKLVVVDSRYRNVVRHREPRSYRRRECARRALVVRPQYAARFWKTGDRLLET